MAIFDFEKHQANNILKGFIDDDIEKARAVPVGTIMTRKSGLVERKTATGWETVKKTHPDHPSNKQTESSSHKKESTESAPKSSSEQSDDDKRKAIQKEIKKVANEVGMPSSAEFKWDNSLEWRTEHNSGYASESRLRSKLRELGWKNKETKSNTRPDGATQLDSNVFISPDNKYIVSSYVNLGSYRNIYSATLSKNPDFGKVIEVVEKPIYERSDEELFSPGKKYINVSHETEMVIDYLNDPVGNGGTVYLKSGSRIDRKDFINYLKRGSVMELEIYQEKQKAKTEAFKNLDAVKLFKKYKIDDVRGWDKQGKRSRVWTTHSDNLSDNKKIVQALNLIPEFEKMGYSVSVKQSHYESKPDSSEVQSEREYSYGKGSNVDITLTKDGKTIELSGSQPYTIDGKKSDGHVSTGGLYNDEELKKFLFSNFVL